MASGWRPYGGRADWHTLELGHRLAAHAFAWGDDTYCATVDFRDDEIVREDAQAYPTLEAAKAAAIALAREVAASITAALDAVDAVPA